MNSYQYLIIGIVGIMIFCGGILIGHYQILPFQELKSYFGQIVESKKHETLEIYDDENHIYNRILFDSEIDLMQTRSEMIDYIWLGSGIPTKSPQVDTNIHIGDFGDIENLQKIDRFTAHMDFGENADKFLQSSDSKMISISYLFHAENPKKTLIIYHQGHGEQSISDAKRIVQFFLDKGYSVLVFTMPAREQNNEPIVDTYRFGRLKLSTHNHFQLIDNEYFHPIKFFIEPIVVTLNYIEKQSNYENIHMLGLSGGGWTTIVYSALDPRISESYSIAGAFPMYMRDKQNLGDYEQTISEFYSIVNYEELFVMSGYGHDRKSIQIFNYNDPCCFQAEIYEKSPYEKIINEKLSELGSGEFQVLLDRTAKTHEISDFALEIIISEIEN